MGRFIQFAIAAADFALPRFRASRSTPENAERIGVYIGSGIGGFEVIEREHKILLEKGPEPHLPVFHSGHHHQPGLRLRLDPHRRQGAEFGHGHGLHHQRALDRRFLPADPARRRRCDDLRRSGGLHHAHGHRRIRRHARAFHSATTSPNAPRRPWDQRPRRLRGRRRRRHPDPRRVGASPCAAARRFWPRWWATA